MRASYSSLGPNRQPQPVTTPQVTDHRHYNRVHYSYEVVELREDNWNLKQFPHLTFQNKQILSKQLRQYIIDLSINEEHELLKIAQNMENQLEKEIQKEIENDPNNQPKEKLPPRTYETHPEMVADIRNEFEERRAQLIDKYDKELIQLDADWNDFKSLEYTHPTVKILQSNSIRIALSRTRQISRARALSRDCNKLILAEQKQKQEQFHQDLKHAKEALLKRKNLLIAKTPKKISINFKSSCYL